MSYGPVYHILVRTLRTAAYTHTDARPTRAAGTGVAQGPSDDDDHDHDHETNLTCQEIEERFRRPPRRLSRVGGTERMRVFERRCLAYLFPARRNEGKTPPRGDTEGHDSCRTAPITTQIRTHLDDRAEKSKARRRRVGRTS